MVNFENKSGTFKAIRILFKIAGNKSTNHEHVKTSGNFIQNQENHLIDDEYLEEPIENYLEIEMEIEE